ncbi:MAG: hypothetical protein K5650_01830 [Bacteroidales bacterium]|nr:hypothetical protein [Bacteroidales bacterium]
MTVDDTERIGAAEVKAMARRAHGDATVREVLVSTMLTAEGREARNAAWVLTHLPTADAQHIAAHREALVRLALTTPDTSLRRLSLALLERIPWDLADVRTDLLDFSLRRLADPSETYGVRALCVKLAWLQCRHYRELQSELRQTLLLLDPATLKPGLKHTWGKVLKQLNP